MIDALIHFSERHRRALSVVGAIWFALGCAVYARFIRLPAIPLASEIVLFSSAAYNAVWWGFLRPELERRRVQLFGTRSGQEVTDGRP